MAVLQAAVIVLAVLVILALSLYTACRIWVFYQWFVFLKHYQELSDRLDEDIKLLRDGRCDEVVVREEATSELVYNFYKKYSKNCSDKD